MATSKKSLEDTRADRLRRALTGKKGKALFKNYSPGQEHAVAAGKSYLRILPWNPKDTKHAPLVPIAQHFNIGGEVVPCLNNWNEGGGWCPVCDMLDKQRGQMSKDEFWAWAAPMRVNTKICAWTLDLTAPTKPPKIVEFPKGIGELMQDKWDDDEDNGCWWKPGSVYDFKLVKLGSGLKTNYDKSEKTTKYANVKTPKLAVGLADLWEVLALELPTEEWQAYIKKLLARQNIDDLGEATSDEVNGTVEDEEVSAEVATRKAKKTKTVIEDDSEEAPEASEEAEEKASEEASEEAEAASEEVSEKPKKKTKAKKEEVSEEAEEASEEVEEDASEEAEEASEEIEEKPKKKTTKAKKEEVSEEASEEEVESDDASEEASEEASAESISEEESEEAPKKKVAPAKKKITAEEMRKKLKGAKR